MHALESSLLALANPVSAEILARFFKTGKGEYGEGDKFLWIRVPIVRAEVKKYLSTISLEDAEGLLVSPWHEIRLAGAISLVLKYEKSKDASEREKIFEFYCEHAEALNNWDLVDLSAPNIFGRELLSYPKKEQEWHFNLFMHSQNLWKRRIAMVSTFAFLKAWIPEPTLKLASMCLTETEPLMHKASGWMLRELGKRCSREELLKFVDKNIEKMPRTMLRYALEHLPKDEYKAYLER